MIQDHMPGLRNLWVTVAHAWDPSTRSTKASGNRLPGYQYPPGSVVIDLIWVTSGLMSFTTAVPSNPEAFLATRSSVKEELYDEELTQGFVIPMAYKVPEFFHAQFQMLYNVFAMLRTAGVDEFEINTLTGWFLSLVRKYIKSKTVTIDLAFVFVCWIRSVAALQGDAGLRRTVGASLLHRWELEERVRASMKTQDKTLHDAKDLVLLELQANESFLNIVRANPLLAGFTLLDAQLSYQGLGCESVIATPRFRGFCHLYSALQDRQLVEPISFFDDAIRVYERATFNPSRAAVTHGVFSALVPHEFDSRFDQRRRRRHF